MTKRFIAINVPMVVGTDLALLQPPVTPGIRLTGTDFPTEKIRWNSSSNSLD
jgi:hypothetical protein